MKNNVIAIVGMCGSGKSVACDYLEEKGYKKVYFGGVVYEEMRKQNIEITPDSQRKFREDLRKEHGMGVVAKILLPRIKELSKNENVVLDGLYSWDEYKILKDEIDNLKMIAIIVDKDIRYERIGKRPDRPFNSEEVVQRDVTEIENCAKGGPIAYADYYIDNNGNLDDYKKRLNEILNKIDNS